MRSGRTGAWLSNNLYSLGISSFLFAICIATHWSQGAIASGKFSRKFREVSVDVECVATGPGHNDRAPCWVAVVDLNGTVLVDEIVRVENVFSPLTHVTGLTEKDIAERGISFEDARQIVRSSLGPDVRLIGQAIQSDIQWLSLIEGADYGDALDIAEKFRYFNARRRRHEYFSLAQTAYGLLGQNIHGSASHSPIEDCKITLRLYREFIKPGHARNATQRLRSMRSQKRFPEWTVTHKRPIIDGVCHFKFNSDKCFCGQPTTR